MLALTCGFLVDASVQSGVDSAIETFMNTEPHLSTRGPADHLCNEATFVEWEQDTSELPDWQTSWRRLVADGRSATLTHASDANETRAFPAPVEPPPSMA
jgi:hypothetical protein